ncbi:MAG: hypothetical protein J2P26_14275, partial [Nocardiopsaceae bacterium]|nr:hypothetical protein [Nocardiopsaceae bacterium]
MLEPRRRPPSAAAGRAVATGRAAARKKRGFLRRTGIVLPAAAIAAVLVALVAIVSYLLSPNGSGASSLSQAIDSLPNNNSVARLEQERQQIIVMNA